MAVDDVSVPERDVAVTDVVPKGTRPSTAHLVIEVACSSQRYDLVHKGLRYAAAGVATFLVLDLAGRRAVVHRQPTPQGYATVTTLGGNM